MEDIESTPLMNKEVGASSSSSWKKIGAACLAGLALSGVVYKEATTNTQEAANTELSSVDFTTFTQGKTNDGFYIYKVAYAAKSGETETLVRFMTDHSGGTSCEAVNLGCEGYKITCDYIDKQIHYVVAPALLSEAVDGDGMGVDGWNEVSMSSFGDMTTWSPFMHDKVQLFVQDVVKKAAELENAGHTVMRRSSQFYQKNEKGKRVKHTLGHVMVAIGGKVWDFIGELADVSTAETEGFDMFAASECPKASELKGYDLNDLHALSEGETSTLLSIQSSASSLDNKGITQVAGLLKSMTGASMAIDKDEYCDVMDVHYFNEWEEKSGGAKGDYVYMKYTVNHQHQTLSNGMTVKDYEDYIFSVHERYLSKPEDKDDAHRWRNWDHWLDMHIGIKYAGASLVTTKSSGPPGPKALYTETTYTDDETMALQDSCLSVSSQLNEYLVNKHVAVGKRSIQEDGDHYYCGFEGSSMTVEFNTECHFGNEGATDICTCNAMNSDNLAMEGYSVAVSSCDVIYTEQDGHPDISVTRDSGSSAGTGGDKPSS